MENVRITKKEDIEYLQFEKLLEFKELTHAYTLKTHDIGFHRNKKEITEQSYEKLCKEFNIDRNKIIQLYQKHTDNIIQAEENTILNKNININASNKNIINEEYLTNIKYIDGIISDKQNIGTLITTADCMPLFFYDPTKKVFANIHSGWRGTVKKIGIKAVMLMINKYGCKAENIICCIGPCIHKEKFLVNDDVTNIYLSQYREECRKHNIIEKTDFQNEKGTQYRIDNIELYKVLLKQIGIIEKNIIDSEICTASNNLFHSRRAEGEKFNTNASFMMLK